MATLTKKDLVKILEDMPDDMEVAIYSGCFYRLIDSVRIEKLWMNGERKEFIALHPTPYAVKTDKKC